MACCDGLIDHKVMLLHQVRYGVDPVPYDTAWNTVGVAFLASTVGKRGGIG
jgi:uncharacterized membrane protein